MIKNIRKLANRLEYRSNVRILTTKKGFEELQKYVKNHTNKNDLNLFECSYIKNEGRTNVYFGWDSVRWESGYHCIDNMMNGLEHLKKLDLSYHYKRTGEFYDDIEIKYYDSPNDILDKYDCVKYVSTHSFIPYEFEGDDYIGI